MASLNNIHLRIFLNSKDAVGSVHQLETALKELREQQRLLKDKGFDEMSKEYKFLEKQVKNILTLQRQNRQVYTDIGKELEHINLLSLRQLKAMERQNNKAVNDLTRQGGDPKELARMREEAEQLRRAIAQYDLKQRDFAAAAKNITGQSADQLRILVQQTLEWTNAQERGSRMARLGAEYYMKFADALAKAKGQMGIGKAERIAGNTRSTQELKAMRRELEDLIALRTGSNTATPDFMRQSSVALNDINEAIKRSEPAKLRSLNDVLADIAKADTPVKLRVLKDELQQLRKAISAGGADNKAFQDTLRSAIASVTDPGTQTQLRDALNKMVVDGFTIDPTKVASMQNAVKAITNAFSNPAALSEAKAARQRLLDSIVDPKMAQRAAEVLDTLFKNPINTANIDTARTSLSNMFGEILTQTKQITKVRTEVTSIFDGLADPRKIATIKSQMETMMNNITDPTHKARAQSIWDSLFAGPIDNNTLKLARDQFDRLFSEIGSTRTSEKAKESMDAIFKGLYEPKNIDSIKTTMATIEKAITDPILKTHVQTYFKEIFARPYDGANLTQYRQMFEQMLDATGMKKRSAEVKAAMDEMFRALANPQDAANVKASISRIFAGLVSSDDVKKVDAGIRQVKDNLKNMAPRDLEQIMKDGVSKGVNATLQQLRDSYASIKKVRDSLLPSLGASDPTIKQMDTELANVDARIVQLSRDIATNRVKASFDDMSIAVKVLEQRMKSLDPNVGKNKQMIADLQLEHRQLNKAINDWGKETMTASQASETLVKAQELLQQGAMADATAVRFYIEQLHIAENAQGQSTGAVAQMANVRKGLTDLLQRQAQATYTAKQADDMLAAADAVLAKGEHALVSEIKEQIKQMQSLKDNTNATAKTSQDATQRIKALEQAMRGASASAKNLVYDEKYVNDTMAKLSTAPINDLRRAYDMVEQRMKSLGRNQQEYFKAASDYRKLKAQIDGVNGSIKQQSDFLSKAANKLLSYIGIFGGFYFVRQQLQKVFDANIKYSDSLTNIQKTTQLSTEAIAQMADNIKRIDTRTALAEITDLAYAAGKLGVKGVSDVMGFVRAANQINIALGEQLKGAESVEQLYKIINIMGTTREFGMENALLKTGSAINHITMNTQATAQPMVDFMKRLAGVSTQAGISTSELVGLAGAVDALGQPVEMSATSISKMLVQISANSKVVAKALKMTQEETEAFRYDIASGRMMEAFLTVLQKTREAGGLSHLATIVKDLGSNGQRVIQTIATLSQNYRTVAEYVRMSNEAFDEGVSVTNEYNIKNENAAALWERLKNQFSKMFVSTDAIDWLKELLVQLQGLPLAVKNTLSALTVWSKVFQGIVWTVTRATFVIEGFLQALSYRILIQFAMGAFKVINAVRLMTVQLVSSSVAALRAGAGLRGVAAAIRSVDTAAAKNAFLLIATAILSVVHYFRDAREEVKRFNEELARDVERIKTQTQSEGVAMDAMLQKLREADMGSLERKSVIEQLNSTYADYLGNLLNEAMSYDEIAASLRSVNAQMRTKALLEGRAESEKNIRMEAGGERGDTREQTIKAIMSLMETPDSATAAKIFDRMVSNAAGILKTSTDGTTGEVTGYSSGILNLGTGSDQQRARALYQAASSIEGAKFRGVHTSPDGSVRFVLDDKTDAVFSNFADYMNATLQMEQKINQSNSMYERDARVEAEEAYKLFGPQMERTWKIVQDAVMYPREGKLNVLATADDQDQWVDRRKTMTDAQRNQEITDLENYIRFGKSALEDLRLLDPDKYRQEFINVSNAEALLKILKLGPLKDKSDKGNKGSKNREAQDAYQNIIAKIKEFYEHQEEAYKRMMLQGELTATQYQQMLDQNAINLHDTLRQARLRILNRIDSGAWDEQIGLMRSQNVAGQGGEEALGRITATGDLRQNIGVPLEKIALGKDEEGTKTSALLSGISFEAEKDFTARLEIVRKRSEELQKLLLEHNPVGKITEQYQVEFEKLGLMLADLTGKTGKELNDIEQQVMAKYLQVGKDAYKFDISTDEGLAAFRAYLENIEGFRDRLRDIAAHENEEGAARLSDVLRGIYYQSYTYAEQYEEAISKLIQKNTRAWERAWKQQSEHKDGLALSSELEQVEKLMKRLEHYGFSARVTLAQNIALREQQLKVQGKMWANNVAQAQKELEAAKADDEKYGTPASADAVSKAQEQLDAVSQMPDAVRTAIEELQNAMLSLQDATDSWVADMVSAFGKFMDGFVPFRSWYEDKGNLADNIFGTKEERQRAFGSFMDDIKKVLRQEMMERTRAAITRWALERKTSRLQKVEIDKQTDVSEKSNVAQEMGAKALGAAEIQVSNAITQAIMANSQKSTAQITADETQKTTTGMWGNFGRAMTEAWAEGGPFMGAVLAAVVSAAVGGIITMVMNMIGHGSSTPTAPKTKLVSGMLTYDRGNVQSVAPSTRPRVRTFDMGLIPVIGDDGRIYMAASESGSMPTGMVNRPTLTTIDGSPALVGERGPEMVIGRETTAAMQMYRPDLIQQIVEFDRNRSRGFARTFDTGTIAPAAEGQPALAGDSDLRDLLLTNQQLMAQMSAVNAALTEQLRKPIQAVINKHGAGGLIEETASGLLEARRAGNIKNVNRLFGR